MTTFIRHNLTGKEHKVVIFETLNNTENKYLDNLVEKNLKSIRSLAHSFIQQLDNPMAKK